MQLVSPEFNTAAEAVIREPKVLVEIIWASPFIDPAVSASANDENRAAHVFQTHDGTTQMGQKWAHLDGTIIADGSFHVMPANPTNSPVDQVGWFGATECDGSAVWVTNPQLTLTFDARPVVDLLVVGDNIYDEYPVDFDVEVYEGATLAYTENVFGNTQVEWTLDVSGEGLDDVTKMVLTVKKWSAPNRVVKIAEFYSFFQQTFTGDVVDSVRILEERVLEDGTLPVGNISANEMDLALNNIKIDTGGGDIIDPFFPDNPNTPYNDVLIQNRQVTPYIGFKLPDNSVEYVKMGTFWTLDWKVNEQDAVVTVACRDRMDRLRRSDYKGSSLQIDTNLCELAKEVLMSARDDIPMPDLTWDIDPTLADFELPYGWFGKTNYFEALRQIAEACMGQVYMSRDDVLIIEGPEQTYTP